MRKKVLIGIALAGLVLFLSGCTSINEPITSESTGFWSKYFVYPLSLTITYFAKLLGNSYGLGIIVVTVIIRLILLPLNIKQLKSSVAMQQIQPELKKLQTKYSSKDANTQRKLQEETMALFEKHKVNPLSGCLPILVQMPVLIAIYQAIMRTSAIKEQSFLWFQLGSPDPYFILAVVAAALTFIQQKVMMAGNGEMQNPQMTAMLYMMPIMIGVFAIFLPSALPLYWIVGNVFMIAQTLLIRQPMMKKEAKASTGGGKK
ncbi:YidC family membrane integrase SpoIIIJ [Virgibacillus sp. 179-BFC.A HS]|uniref:Membrane protein insertase YidC n=1 Tax=Tigheibacillus jepli TaxID=3035914 RepID=A0ABU5CCR9_9BACI|nr:YidC family membrane integrase SpoIIIJ [Virgibacillus sp. 179-BFC.A HS]MDY0404122.1 YidC family membrane integrase SpoIIIJ [Virgibacillus sp. 179-BFC.A HS]